MDEQYLRYFFIPDITIQVMCHILSSVDTRIVGEIFQLIHMLCAYVMKTHSMVAHVANSLKYITIRLHLH